MKRLRISLKREPTMTVSRVSIGHQKLAYVICADKKIRYKKGRSYIAYIGTTKNGISRVAESAATRSDKVLRLRGINSFVVRTVTCTARQHVESWRALERALILVFREKYGEAPKANIQGQHKNYTWHNERQMFSVGRLNTIVEDLS